jgi:serine phosphatase RsbU (regulator of sigma subunit)
MTRDQELWACALAIERKHGESAFLHAAMEIDRLDAEGVSEAAGVWREVLKRLNALERGLERSQ